MKSPDVTFLLGVVTDEIAEDPAVALPAAREMGFSHVELNRVGGRGVHELSDAEIADLGRMIAGEGLQVVAVDPPAFKAIELDEVPAADVTRHPAVVEHLEQVRRSCHAAGELGAGIVRVFSFRRSYMTGAGNPSPREARGGAIPDALLPKIAAGCARRRRSPASTASRSGWRTCAPAGATPGTTRPASWPPSTTRACAPSGTPATTSCPAAGPGRTATAPCSRT